MTAPDLFATLPDPSAPASAAREAPARCAVCGAALAPFGVGVALAKGRPGVWYCRDHRPGRA